jgi:hypothetical protein
MQIGLLNQLNFPDRAGAPAAGNASESSAGTSVSQSTGSLPAPASASDPTTSAASVVLSLRSDGDAGSGQTLKNGLIYSNGLKPAPNQDADTAGMAEQYRLAMQRTGGSPANLSVDKNGVLSASTGSRPVNGSASDSNSQDFVTFAVTTMRDLADSQDRLKNSTAQATGSAAASLVAKGLGDVQKLAARFKLFA